MNPRISKYFDDILTCTLQIKEFMHDISDFNEFTNNIMLKKAIERNLEIIGEAMNTILKIEPNIQIRNSRKIVEVRNRLIHDYDNIDDVIIWGIVMKYLDELLEDIRKYI